MSDMSAPVTKGLSPRDHFKKMMQGKKVWFLTLDSGDFSVQSRRDEDGPPVIGSYFEMEHPHAAGFITAIKDIT